MPSGSLLQLLTLPGSHAASCLPPGKVLLSSQDQVQSSLGLRVPSSTSLLELAISYLFCPADSYPVFYRGTWGTGIALKSLPIRLLSTVHLAEYMGGTPYELGIYYGTAFYIILIYAQL